MRSGHDRHGHHHHHHHHHQCACNTAATAATAALNTTTSTTNTNNIITQSSHTTAIATTQSHGNDCLHFRLVGSHVSFHACFVFFCPNTKRHRTGAKPDISMASRTGGTRSAILITTRYCEGEGLKVLCHDDDRHAYSHPCVRSPETSTGDVARSRQLCVSLRQFKTYRAYVALTKTICAVMWILGFAAISSGDRIQGGEWSCVGQHLDQKRPTRWSGRLECGP